jgi:hypothetical protein
VSAKASIALPLENARQFSEAMFVVGQLQLVLSLNPISVVINWHAKILTTSAD